MGLRSALRRAAFNRHVLIDKLDSNEPLREFLSRFRENYVTCDLIRVGGDEDGGYLVPDILTDIKYCFSPGVDYTATFEKELSETYGIKSFMADASVPSAPITDVNFEFTPKFLGSRTHGVYTTLSDWVRESIGEDDSARILQMDIEGGEYDVLTVEDQATLASFSTLIIEFHELHKLFRSDFLGTFSAIFEKLYQNFSICHVHPNNISKVATLDGIQIPAVIEVTFIRNDLISQVASNDTIKLPHALDRQNVAHKPDMFMPEIWWKS